MQHDFDTVNVLRETPNNSYKTKPDSLKAADLYFPHQLQKEGLQIMF